MPSANHSFWRLPVDASLHGPALDHHLLLNLWIALTLLGVAHLLLLASLLLRRTTRPASLWLSEYFPLGAISLLFLFLGVRAERLWAAQRYTGADLSAMQVEVTGVQFAWYFRYPGADMHFGLVDLSRMDAATGNPLGLDPRDPYATDDIVSSQLVLPADREVDLALRSTDVIHGFAIPELRLKQNTVPGETAHIHFTPTLPGDYAILCTQVCGSGHYRMNATLRVLPPEQFNAWLSQREAEQQRLSQMGARP
jgi:cytochrome c oxidase subunit 2